MAREKKQEECKAGVPAWMVTFSDMCTLLLTFFVMLLTMANFEVTKFKIAANSLQQAFGVLQSYPNILISEQVYIPKLGGDEQRKKMAAQAAKKIRQKVQERGMNDAVKVKVTDTGIAVKISDPVLFDVGNAQIKSSFTPVLNTLAEVVKEQPEAEIRVEGHTDNTPINTPQFPSNWELSAARAMEVVKLLAFKYGVNPSRLSGVGYGEYRPVEKNSTAENKKKNRRIEVYIEYLKKK
ncbi:MAG: flagellar motor protein MotB [bacterium]